MTFFSYAEKEDILNNVVHNIGPHCLSLYGKKKKYKFGMTWGWVNNLNKIK